MNYVIILAGGVGSRFWPLSRESDPKQFLSIYSGKSQIEETVRRISPLIKKENIYIAANKIHSQKLKTCIARYHIPAENLFFEPEAKSTMAPIAVLSRIINNLDKNAIIAVLPSDHYVGNRRKFSKLFTRGVNIAKKGHIVTFGVPAGRPETGYGYIKASIESGEETAKQYYRVDKFTEKPSRALAKNFIKDKRYYWNSGIFIFRADIMLEEIRKFAPKAHGLIMQIRDKKSVIRLWPDLPSVSIDYSVIEKTNKAAVLPAECGWNDLGSWQALIELMKKDKARNIFKGKCLDIGSRNIFVWSDNRLVATLGLDNIIVVDTEDALLVCNKDKSQEVKKMVQLLKRSNFKKYI